MSMAQGPHSRFPEDGLRRACRLPERGRCPVRRTAFRPDRNRSGIARFIGDFSTPSERHRQHRTAACPSFGFSLPKGGQRILIRKSGRGSDGVVTLSDALGKDLLTLQAGRLVALEMRIISAENDTYQAVSISQDVAR